MEIVLADFIGLFSLPRRWHFGTKDPASPVREKLGMDRGKQISERVKALYDDIGWKEVSEGITHDAHAWEDLRPVSRNYLADTRRRVKRHLPPSGDRLLDMASGPIQYPEYLEYSDGFKTRVCVDLSERALEMAQAKIGDHGEYLCGDFLDLDVPANSMDATVSLHTIYHIHASRQSAVVRKLIEVTKPGAPVVIVYSNPNNLVSMIARTVRRLFGKTNSMDGSSPSTIYFEPQPLVWWQQFSDVAHVRVYPWRSFSTPVLKRLIPSNEVGARLLTVLFNLEDRFPRFFVRFGVYPMIVLSKR